MVGVVGDMRTDGLDQDPVPDVHSDVADARQSDCTELPHFTTLVDC
jgi:hypothetical protein